VTIINKKYYAVTIDTETTITDPDIGLSNGVMRFTTDNYSPPTESNWNGDLLASKSFGVLSSSVNIEEGGDYGFLSNAGVRIINSTMVGGSFYDRVFNTHEINLLKLKVSIFVIIDDTFYSIWVGSVKGYSFSDDNIVLDCGDSKDDSTVTVQESKYGYIEKLPLKSNSSSGSDELNYFSAPLLRARPYDSNSKFEYNVDEYKFNSDGTIEEYYKYVSGALANNKIFIQRIVGIEVPQYIIINNNGSRSEPIIVKDMYSDGYYHDNVTYFEVTAIIIDGKIPINTTADMFGNFDVYSDSRLDDLSSYTNVTVEFYSNLTHLQNYNPVYSDNVLSENGSSIPTGEIIEKDGSYFLPVSVTATKSAPITDSKVQLYYSSSPAFGNIVNNSLFTVQYEGYYYFQDLSKPYAHNKIDVAVALSEIGGVTAYEKIYIGIVAKPSVYRAKYNLLESYGLLVYDMFYGKTVIEYYKYGDNNQNTNTYQYSRPQKAFIDMIGLTVVPSSIDPFYGFLVHDTGDNTQIELPINKTMTVDSVNELVEFNWVKTTNMKSEASVLSTAYTPNCNHLYYVDNYELGQDLLLLGNIDIDDKTNPDIKGYLDYNSELLVILDGRYRNGTTYWKYHNVSVGNARINIDPETTGAMDVNVDYYLVGETIVDTASDNVWSTYHDENTDNVYKLFKHLTLNNGDYTKLIDRDTWEVGRYIESQTQISNLITDLCRQSCVVGFSGRLGESVFVTLKHYMNNVKVVTSDDIIKGTLGSIKTSNLTSAFNEFKVLCNKSNYVDVDSFDTISIQKVNEQEFPPNGNSGEWEEYVSGIEDYDVAKSLWGECVNSYNIVKKVNKAGSDITDLTFSTIKDSDFYDSFGYKATECLISWSSRPKLSTTFSLPMISEWIGLDIMDEVQLVDTILGTHVGFVVAKKFITNKDEIEVKLLFDMPDRLFYNFIIEHEDNVDFIVEHEDNTDFFIEGRR